MAGGQGTQEERAAGGTTVTLAYPGKWTEADILAPVASAWQDLAAATVAVPAPNALIWADNWLALHALRQSGCQARLVYLDPPYATGRDFHHARSLEHAYADVLDEAASVESIRRRLVLLREILAPDGSLYLHIGHQMLAPLKLVLDEVFGAANCRNIITRRHCSSKNFTRNQYPKLNDYLLFYSRGPRWVWNPPIVAPDADWIAREYPKVDARGQYKLVPVHAPGLRQGDSGSAWRGRAPPPGKHWQYVPARLDELDAQGEIHWSKTGNPRRKVYLTPAKGVPRTDYWDDFRDAHHQSVLVSGYPTEKNFDMMKMLVAASSAPGDLVLDPYCGSGSTLHAAEALGRRWIGIDQSLMAVKSATTRLTRGRQPLGALAPQVAPDAGQRHEASAASFAIVVEQGLAAREPEGCQALAGLAP